MSYAVKAVKDTLATILSLRKENAELQYQLSKVEGEKQELWDTVAYLRDKAEKDKVVIEALYLDLERANKF